MGDMVCFFRPLYLRCTVERQLCPLRTQISNTFIVLMRFYYVIAASNRDTEKPVASALPQEPKTAKGSCLPGLDGLPAMFSRSLLRSWAGLPVQRRRGFLYFCSYNNLSPAC